jgi:predicted transcriptional regulator
MTAAHILVRLTKEGKSIDEIAREDFNNNLELVSVWIDYMAAINWIYKDGSKKNKWIITNDGKKWVEKILQHKLSEGKRTYRV